MSAAAVPPTPACGCAHPCRHCQACWAAGYVHNEFGSPGALGRHVLKHRDAPPVPVKREPVRALDRGEREYVRRRLEFVAAQLGNELRCSTASVLTAIPGVLKEQVKKLAPVPAAECLQTGPAVLVGIQITHR